MAQSRTYNIAVIGGGAAGTMAVSYALHNNDDVILFPGSGKHKKKSRAFWVTKIENMPGLFSYKKAIENPNKELLDSLATGPFSSNFTRMKNRGVFKIQKNKEGLFEIEDNKGEFYLCRYIVMATGLMDVQPLIQGSIKPVFPYANIQLIDYCLRCDGHHVVGKSTSIVGHGAGAAWVAIMLHERYRPVEMKIITNGEKAEFSTELWEMLDMYNISVVENKIVEVKGDAKAHRLEGYTLDDGSFFKTEFSFISLGMIIYNELAKSLGAKLDDRGFVLSDAQGATNIEGLFVVGDLRAGLKKQVYSSWRSSIDTTTQINKLIREKSFN